MTFVDELERRGGFRRREKLPCKLLIDGRKRAGMLRDLAAGGLFVETRDDVPPGADVIVAFQASESHRFVVEALVARKSPVSRSLAGLASRGCGLRIQDPPRSYLHWLEATGQRSGS